MSKHYIIPIFVPHLGCPHDCVFCNQKKIASQTTDITKENVKNTISRYLGYFKSDSFIEVAFYGGSFTAIDLKVQKELLSIPCEYKKRGIIDEIRMSTRPDAIDDEIIMHLMEYKVDTVELGVQSMSDKILKASGRGHLSLDVYKAVKKIKKYNINVGLQMMIGLPGDTLEDNLYTLSEFIKLDPYCVRIYPTLIIRDTYLETLFLRKDYIPMSLKEAVDRTTIILMIFYLKNINVIRIGLQPTENIQLGKDVIDGPFHPAFRQLVESNIYEIIINKKLEKMNISGKDLKIYANNKEISNISGQKSRNREKIIKTNNLNSLSLVPSNIDSNVIILEVDNRKIEIKKEREMMRYVENFLKKESNFTLEDFNLI